MSREGRPGGSLQGSTALVTGASQGIGRAIALALAREGARVCLVARTRAALYDVRRSIGDRGPVPLVACADVTDDAQVEALVADVRREMTGLDVLVHAAGVVAHGRQEALPVAELDRQYRTNVRAPFLLTQTLLPLLRSAGGQVVFVNSTLGSESRANVGAYAATKHALRALADALRAEVNADGVRVLSVYPGRTATPAQAALYAAAGQAYDPKRLLQPEDVASIVLAAVGLPRTAEVTDVRIRPMLKSY
jgi:NAD(P)-dependent dehydrogenase (short-subunit alcohol dehydrogenase family)